MLYNEARAQDLLRTHGVDAIVAASRIGVDYVTGHRSTFESTFLGYHTTPGGHARYVHRSFGVAPASGERILVVHAAIAATTVPDWTGGLELYAGGGIDPAAETLVDEEFRGLARQLARATADVDHLGALAAALRRSVSSGGRVAIEADGLLPGELETLRGLVPELEIADGSVLLRLIRMVKTTDEIERSRRAAEIAEVALRASIDAAAEGVTLAELAAGLPRARGCRGRRPRALRHRPVRARHRHHLGLPGAAAGRPAARRRLPLPLDDLRHLRDALARAAAGRGRRALRPGARLRSRPAPRRIAVGAKVGDVANAMRAVVDGTLAESSAPQGHGLGLEPKELPFIAADRGLRLKDDCVDLDANQTLEPDMVLNLEVPHEVPGQYAVHVERTFVLDRDGLRGITEQDRSTEAIPAGAGA